MLQVKNLLFAYDKKPVLKDIGFELQRGQLLAIAGESGSGKSTLLKLIYGQYDLAKGSIYFKGDQILGPKFNLIQGPDNMKYVSQEFDLMPFTSVEKNIGEYLSNFYPAEKTSRVAELIKVVELEAFSKTKVKALSGGQKQRVALARALAKKPELLLLDEPFSHIDNLKKQSLRRKLFSYLKDEHIMSIVATHDKDDIISYADQMIFLNKGLIIAHDTPKALYKKPKNRLIASFFDNYNVLELAEIGYTGKQGSVIIYPHEVRETKQSKFKAVVKHSYFKGDYYLIVAHFNGKELFFTSQETLKATTEISFTIDRELIKKRSLK